MEEKDQIMAFEHNGIRLVLAEQAGGLVIRAKASHGRSILTTMSADDSSLQSRDVLSEDVEINVKVAQ